MAFMTSSGTKARTACKLTSPACAMIALTHWGSGMPSTARHGKRSKRSVNDQRNEKRVQRGLSWVCESGTKLRDVMHAYGLPLPLRLLDARALTSSRSMPEIPSLDMPLLEASTDPEAKVSRLESARAPLLPNLRARTGRPLWRTMSSSTGAKR